MSGRPVPLPRHGIVLSSALARTLGVEAGDAVIVEAMEGRRPTLVTHVAGLIDDFSGLAAYMHLGEMNRLMREPDVIGGAYVLVDSAKIDALYHRLREAPEVIAVNVKAATVASFRETIGRNIELMRPFLIGFSVAIAFGVIYNGARISLSERARDLATLRVLGFSTREVATIQLGEMVIVTGVAIPIGLLLGWGLAWMTSEATASELFRIPFVIAPSTFAFAAVVVAIASVVCGLIVRGRLGTLDLVSVLKSRE